ncbi:hypothetical protein [Mesomycoplasma ovipneumoniae]|uniref:hypothetical protein n=1 Tax=Mesomycoplasma ovipneumoniae TaxID=29562 RepID=UPI00307FEBB5
MTVIIPEFAKKVKKVVKPDAFLRLSHQTGKLEGKFVLREIRIKSSSDSSS